MPLSEFNYLVKMPMISMTLEKVKKLEKQLEEKTQEIASLRKKTVQNMWVQDLDKFLEVLEEVEADEIAEFNEIARKVNKGKKGKGAKKGAKKKPRGKTRGKKAKKPKKPAKKKP